MVQKVKDMSVSTKSRREMSFERKLKVAEAHIGWYHAVLTWALNRCENTPQAITQLIKERSSEIHREAIYNE